MGIMAQPAHISTASSWGGEGGGGERRCVCVWGGVRGVGEERSDREVTEVEMRGCVERVHRTGVH